MVEVFKVQTENESVSYHGSKKAAMDRAMRDVMRYSKYCKGDASWHSNIFKAKFMGEDPDAIAESLTLETGKWHWPECQDLIAVQSSKDGGTTYRYDDEEEDKDRTAEAMRRVFLEYLDALEALKCTGSAYDYVNNLRAIASLYKPFITKTLYNRVMETDENTTVMELADLRDSLHIDCRMPSDESKVMEAAYNVIFVEGYFLEQRALALKLLKAMLDARK